MAYAPEPAYHHDQPTHHSGTAVLLCNLGTPDAPTAPALRRYLAQFLSDPRIVEIPKWLWMVILHGIILRVRPAKSAKKYASIWTPKGSPLRAWTDAQAQGVQDRLLARGLNVTVLPAMRYGQPDIAGQIEHLKGTGHTRVLVIPMYPQYSGTTTGSVIDDVARWSLGTRHVPEFRWINRFHDHPGYIEAMARDIEASWASHGRAERLVLSFHGVPQRTLDLGDPYHCECRKTARLLSERLGLDEAQVLVTFQSRFGKAKWLEPSTEPTLVNLAAQSVKSVDLYCPGFVSDCLETLEELDQEAQHAFLAAGGTRLNRIACLNAGEHWLDELTDLCVQHLQGWPMQAPAEADARRIAQARGASAAALGCPVGH